MTMAILSGVGVGLAMTILETSLSSRALGKQLELLLLEGLGRILVVVLAVYSVLRVQDLYHGHALELLLAPSYERNLFLLEVVTGLALPMALLLIPRVRETANVLYVSAVIVLLGFITNRLDVSITGMGASAGVRYFPKWTELAVAAAIIASGFAIFALAAKHLPIFAAKGQWARSEKLVTAPLTHVCT